MTKPIYPVFPDASRLVINLRPPLYKLDGLYFHAFGQRLRFGDTFLGGEVAHVLRDFHRAEMRAVHGAEVCDLGRLFA